MSEAKEKPKKSNRRKTQTTAKSRKTSGRTATKSAAIKKAIAASEKPATKKTTKTTAGAKSTKTTKSTKTSAPAKPTAATKAPAKKPVARAKVVKIVPEDKGQTSPVTVKKKTAKKAEKPEAEKAAPIEKAPEPVKNEPEVKPAVKPEVKPAPKPEPVVAKPRVIEEIRIEPVKEPAPVPLDTVNNGRVEEPPVPLEPAKKPTPAKSDTEKALSLKKSRPAARRSHFGLKRFLLVIACAAAAVFAIVYFVNLNTPNAELRIAALQTGINGSTYPNYVPRDFSLTSFTAETGKMTLYFENHSTGEAFSLMIENSSWDSNSLYTNYVKSAYGDNYTAIKEQGLTLYVAGSGACWVNGGTLYKINVTSGSLTKKQIKAIAVSL